MQKIADTPADMAALAPQVKKTFFVSVLLITSAMLNAQAPWGLKECITYGLEHHLTNEIYRGNMEKAKQVTNENIALYFPQISADFMFDDYIQRQTQIVSIGTLGVLEETEVQLWTKFVTTASFQVEQALFDKVLLNSFRGLKPNRAVAELTFQQNQEALVYNISQAYIQVHVLKQQIILLSENIKKFEKLHEIVKLQYEKGVAKKIDADRISIALNNTKSQLSVAESGYELAVSRLKYAIGLKLEEEILLKESVEIIPETLDSGFDVNRKTEMQIQENSIRLLDVQKNRTGGGYYPRLAFYARYTAQSLSNEFEDAFSSWYDFSSFGFKLNVPIFDGLQRRGQSKQAAINIQNARYNLELSEQAFRLQHQNAVNQLKRAKTNLENTEMNVQLAKDVFDNTALQYQQGVAALSEFLNSETSYKEAQSNYLTAVLNYYTAVIDLEKANGTLMEFYSGLEN